LVLALDLFQHLIVKFPTASLGQQTQGFAVIQVVVKLAVAADASEGPAIDQAALPWATESPMGNVLVAANEMNELGGTTETVAQVWRR
jgi:hypothetical protein